MKWVDKIIWKTKEQSSLKHEMLFISFFFEHYNNKFKNNQHRMKLNLNQISFNTSLTASSSNFRKTLVKRIKSIKHNFEIENCGIQAHSSAQETSDQERALQGSQWWVIIYFPLLVLFLHTFENYLDQRQPCSLKKRVLRWRSMKWGCIRM